MPDAAELLMKDHRKVEGLFDQFTTGDTSVIPQVCAELTVHTTIEEEVLYPVLSEVTNGPELRQEAQREHQEVKDAIARIERLGVDSTEVGSLMQHIIDGVTHHVREEETELFPKMSEELGADRMVSLGDKLAAAKRKELARRGLLVDLTKDELYELAQSTGIDGRSNMSKGQLVAALKR